jgi:hypothetical protein
MRETPTIKIERGIPIPNNRYAGVQAVIREAFRKMEVGESCVIPETANSGAYQCAKQVRIQIKTRKLNGDGYRVWRTA